MSSGGRGAGLHFRHARPERRGRALPPAAPRLQGTHPWTLNLILAPGPAPFLYSIRTRTRNRTRTPTRTRTPAGNPCREPLATSRSDVP